MPCTAAIPDENIAHGPAKHVAILGLQNAHAQIVAHVAAFINTHPFYSYDNAKVYINPQSAQILGFDIPTCVTSGLIAMQYGLTINLDTQCLDVDEKAIEGRLVC